MISQTTVQDPASGGCRVAARANFKKIQDGTRHPTKTARSKSETPNPVEDTACASPAYPKEYENVAGDRIIKMKLVVITPGTSQRDLEARQWGKSRTQSQRNDEEFFWIWAEHETSATEIDDDNANTAKVQQGCDAFQL